ncbi:MAG: hypothetical protein L0Y56_10935, partial [Nitrospira sp.]|nr:hypothetical protein [Nitrospira sp.]
MHPGKSQSTPFLEAKLNRNLFIGLFLAIFLTGCSETTPSTLAPKGPGAAEIAFLWWLMLGLATFIFILVMALLLFGLFRPRHNQEEEEAATQKRDRWFVVAGGIVMPLVILTIV